MAPWNIPLSNPTKSIIIGSHLLSASFLLSKLVVDCWGPCQQGIPAELNNQAIPTLGSTLHLLPAYLLYRNSTYGHITSATAIIASAIFFIIQIWFSFFCPPCLLTHGSMAMAGYFLLRFKYLITVTTTLLIAGFITTSLRPNGQMNTQAINKWPKDIITGDIYSPHAVLVFTDPECTACQVTWPVLRDDLRQNSDGHPVVIHLTYQSPKGQALVTLGYAAANLSSEAFLNVMDKIMNQSNWEHLEPQDTINLIPEQYTEQITNTLQEQSHGITRRLQLAQDRASLVNLRYQPTYILWQRTEITPLKSDSKLGDIRILGKKLTK